jgi:hypothetical protein
MCRLYGEMKGWFLGCNNANGNLFSNSSKKEKKKEEVLTVFLSTQISIIYPITYVVVIICI